MLSRSAVVKLKAVLIIDLIIVGAAVGAYFYLQDQGVIAGASKPANLVISDFQVTPSEAYIGDTIQISANVTNIGDEDGNATYSLVINGQVKDAVNVTLASQMSQLLEFTDMEMSEGNYSVALGEAEGYFIIKEPPPDTSKIVLSDYKATPYETWPDKPVNVTVLARNPSPDPDRIFIRVTVDGVVFTSKMLELEAGASEALSFPINATSEGKHVVMLNSLKGTFTVVQEGYHTVTINRSGGGSKPLPITLNGQSFNTPYQALLPVGEYSISVPTPFNVGTGVLAFTSWSDGINSASRTFTVGDDRFILVVTYTVISGYASCPSMYTWNGTGYSYITDVSNPGWLGYISYITHEGTIVFGGGNPYDYVKIDSGLLAEKNGAFDITLAQQWDELFYLDKTYMLVVDHPIGTDAYTSMTNYLNKGETGQIYTVTDSELLSPVSATNEKGQDILAYIIEKDGLFTPGINGIESTSWDNIQKNQLILDLGNLTGAPEVKLVITGMVDWGLADTYYEYLDMFKTAAAQGVVPNGTEIMPAPYLEVLAANGSWIRAPQERQIPLPSDYNARTFTVDLTGLFPSDVSDYKVRFTNFWNVTFDYIGIDTTAQQTVNIQKLTPTSATLEQWWADTNSTSTGAFTRYGDVTPLVQEADDMFVVGRQCDAVNLQFSTENLSEPDEGMVRDYFFVVACWFKDPPGEWGYGFTWTVDPMPFLAMSGYPYTDAEHYPTDAAHIAYIKEYNTRIIN